jgi:hypothetical protein
MIAFCNRQAIIHFSLGAFKFITNYPDLFSPLENSMYLKAFIPF